MRALARTFILTFFMFFSVEAQEWFTESHAWIEIRHNAYVPPGTNHLLREIFVADATMNGEIDIAQGPSWRVTATFKMQNILGGFKERRAKVYAVNYIVELAWRKRIWAHGPWFYLSSFHQSTHLADPLPIETARDVIAFRELSIDIADVNLLRLGFVSENGDDIWRAIFQPIRMTYFLFVEPKYMFEKGSYEEYGKRLYVYGFKTLWRDGQYRVGVSGEGELEGGTHYILQARVSARITDDPSWDKIQLFIAYEGGLHTNRVRSTPYNGLSAERLSIGGRLIF
ncbi:MAG: hypothetical protein Q8P88_01195 [Candidatus Jorgensenbacteria bacterium]|nr:hypothetical protein [Candidatus Jorgensenbacteria bacterium]